jgi:hypothetical protein
MGAGCKVLLELQRVYGVELTVHETMQHQLPAGTGIWGGAVHGAFS